MINKILQLTAFNLLVRLNNSVDLHENIQPIIIQCEYLIFCYKNDVYTIY